MKNINDLKSQRPVKIEYTYSFKVNHSIELLEFLLSKLNMSRNSIKGLLKDHKVLVNGSTETQFNYPLAKDDEVKISKHPQFTNSKNNKIRQNFKFSMPEVIFENNEFIAINKPSGLLSVESDKDSECALRYMIEYMKEKDPKSRPFQLHRIDKDTSGVLVFAKNIKLHSMLKMHWNEYITIREYYCICEGKFEKKKDTIISYLKENQNNMVYITKNEKDKDAKKAITNYEVVKENDNYSLLKVTIDTGRKNQIRVQMASLNHPIIGDEKYGNGNNPINRLALHASALEFVHPINKNKIYIKANLPEEFKKFMR